MTHEELITLNEKNIRQALEDYGRHTTSTCVLEDISGTFISEVAKKSTESKTALRELFRKSPVWNEKLQALIINGTRTHDPDYGYIAELGYEILNPAVTEGKITNGEKCDIVWYFSNPEDPEQIRNAHLDVINRIAPKAYAPNKKPSRIFKAICKELGVVDETAGSDFQKYFALFADELSSKKISFKLFVSINPAHFLTMSNPKNDERGCTLTSCHSLNSTEYTYNAGCSGYACDDVSIIAFTVADPTDAESLNNRKTTRQIFAYKPGNGVLLQSRLYNTYGGTRGAQSFGSFSDISIVAPALGVAAVNLSSGYYNAHTLHEYIDTKQLNATICKVQEIVKEAAIPDFPKYEYIEAISYLTYGNRNEYSYYGYDYRDHDYEAFLKNVPDEILDECIDLLELYSPEELKMIRIEYGDAMIHELWEYEFFEETKDNPLSKSLHDMTDEEFLSNEV